MTHIVHEIHCLAWLISFIAPSESRIFVNRCQQVLTYIIVGNTPIMEREVIGFTNQLTASGL